MTLEEAMKRYSIPIPENIYDYDEEKYKEFHKMYLSSFYETFYSNEKMIPLRNDSENVRMAVVLGGQTGAGKSALIAETKKEFKANGRNIVLIDDDQYRKLYPYGKEILRECPEFYTKITAIGTGKITPKILRFAAENGYNFIFDGTMKNPRIVETMRTWKGYTIQVKIMATSRLRSIASIAIRNGELRKIGKEGRHISVDAHDETYTGIPATLRYLEDTKLAQEIKIYMRGANVLLPIQKYSSLDYSKTSSADVLERLREEDEERFLQTAGEDIEYLKILSSNLSEEEIKEIYKIIEIINARRAVTERD